ncbi:MAG: MarR family transcriptional regulator [Paracoccaceae bacterium]
MSRADDIARIREEFIEKIGVIAQGEGLPRIAGRVFATLVYDGERVSFSELADRLGVSRGSISASARQLEQLQVIKRVAKPGDRQDYFQVAPDAFVALLETSALRARRASKDIAATLDELPNSEAGPRARLKTYADFYDVIDTALIDAGKKMQART